MKHFYKILPKDLKTKGFQYKEGLNVDTKPFKDNHKCGGGLHFTDDINVLDFLHYGDMIADVSFPEGELVRKIESFIPPNIIKYKAHRIILSNIRPLTDDIICEIIENKKRIIMEKNIEDSEKFKNIDVKDVWLPDHDWAYIFLSSKVLPNAKLVERLITEENANIHFDGDIVLLWAVSCGYIDTVKCLFEHGIDVAAYGNNALYLAIKKNNLDLVDLLIEKGIKIKRKALKEAKIKAKKQNNYELYNYLKKLKKEQRRKR